MCLRARSLGVSQLTMASFLFGDFLQFADILFNFLRITDSLTSEFISSRLTLNNPFPLAGEPNKKGLSDSTPIGLLKLAPRSPPKSELFLRGHFSVNQW